MFWFILLISLLYLIFPLLYKIMFNRKYKPKIILFVFVFLNISISFFIFKNNLKLYNNIEIALNRITIFLIGIYFGKKVFYKERMGIENLILIVLFIISNLIFREKIVGDLAIIMSRYLKAIAVVPFVSILSIFMEKLTYIKNINKLLEFIGKYTFELYITHDGIREVFKLCHIKTYNIKNYILLIIISIVFSYILVKLNKNVLKILNLNKEVRE